MIIGKIEVNHLKVYAHIGLFEQERKVGNLFDVTVHVSHPLDDAVADRLDGDAALNYADLVALIKREMEPEALLIENAAHRILTAIRAAYPLATDATVRVAKLTPPLGEDLDSVAVTLTASRSC